jgi:hypothetical protein
MLDIATRSLAQGLAVTAALLLPAIAHAQAMELKPARLEYEFYPSAGVNGAGAPPGGS